MNRSSLMMRGSFGPVIMVAVTLLSTSECCDAQTAVASGNKQAPRTITLVDQNGRVSQSAVPSATSQIFDVTVAPGGVRVFSPNSLNVAVGDTVRWTWEGDFHSVTSGEPCTADSQFCSPDDMNCAAGVLSNAGTVYTHTFGQAGDYSYFCSSHCLSGMTGTIHVAANCIPRPSGMVGWYPGDGNAFDIHHGNTATLQGSAAYAPGMVGQAFSLDGVDAFVQAPPDPVQDPTTAGSQDVWVKFNQLPSAAGHVMEIIGKGGPSTDFDLQAEGDNLFHFYVSAGFQVASTTVIQTGVWYHIAGTFDATGSRIYVNGQLENTQTAQNLARSPSGQPLEIGNQPTFGPRLFNGLIDEVEIFDRVLTAAEIQAIFNAGAAGKCKTARPVSRKTHGGAGALDVDLPLSGTAGIECRTGGGATNDHQMFVVFTDSVTVNGNPQAQVTSGMGIVGSGGTSNGGMVTISANTVAVPLTNVANAQTINVTLFGVNGAGNLVIPMGVLLGDSNGNGAVNASDVAQTKGRIGQVLTTSNFRSDVNANGGINASDVSIVKSHSGVSLPPN